MVIPTNPTTTNAPEGNPTMTTTAPDTAAIRAALVELLTTGQHHHAATPATLAAVGATRTALDQTHRTRDPAARYAPPERRLTALATALGAVGTALGDPDPWNQLNITILRAGLCDLAAVALGWLDTLPIPTTPGDNGADDSAGDEEPF